MQFVFRSVTLYSYLHTYNIHEHARARAHTHTHIHTHADIYMYEVSNVTTSHVCTISKNRRALLSFTIR